MERKSFAGMHCSVAQCLEVVGDWWSMLIVRDAFLGISRFDAFQRRLGISRNVLNQRLGALVDAGILEKAAYSERPLRYDYQLTDKGRDLWPVLTAMRQWGDKHAAPDGPPARVRHTGCGHITQPVLTCSACGDRLDSTAIRAEAGPGDLDRLIGAGAPGR
jgi:DNA-binding HxlR family transcriptional regulator